MLSFYFVSFIHFCLCCIVWHHFKYILCIVIYVVCYCIYRFIAVYTQKSLENGCTFTKSNQFRDIVLATRCWKNCYGKLLLFFVLRMLSTLILHETLKEFRDWKFRWNSIQILVHFDLLNFPNNNFSNLYSHRICRIFIHQFNSWLIKWHPQALRNKASLTVSSQRMMSMLLSNYLKIHSLR